MNRMESLLFDVAIRVVGIGRRGVWLCAWRDLGGVLRMADTDQFKDSGCPEVNVACGITKLGYTKVAYSKHRQGYRPEDISK